MFSTTHPKPLSSEKRGDNRFGYTKNAISSYLSRYITLKKKINLFAYEKYDSILFTRVKEFIFYYYLKLSVFFL